MPRGSVAQPRTNPAVEQLASALVGAGLAPMPGRVWAALLSDSDGRMTAAELAKALQVSPAGVSGAVRYLIQVGFIRRERQPGSRRDVYVAVDAWHVVLARADRTYAPILRALDEGVASASDPQARARLAEFREYLAFVSDEMRRMGERWERHRRGLRKAPPTARVDSPPDE